MDSESQLGIDEEIPSKVPELLSEETISAIKRRIKQNRTHNGKPKYRYLLNGLVICGTCVRRLTGQPTNGGKQLVYRHVRASRKNCPLSPGIWVQTTGLEDAVLWKLFRTLGNRKAMERAMRQGQPDNKGIKENLKRQERVQDEIVS